MMAAPPQAPLAAAAAAQRSESEPHNATGEAAANVSHVACIPPTLPGASARAGDPPAAVSAGRSGRAVGWVVAGTAAAIIGLVAPFFIVPWLPRHLFGALPWLPTSPRRVNALLDSLPAGVVAPGRAFIDLGSGDGVAVIEAAKRGMRGVGVELNPTLVALSRLNAARAGGGVWSRTRFGVADLFRTSVSEYDVIMVFGVIPMMPRLAAKLDAELVRDTYVASHKFPLPGWDRRLSHVVDDIFVYHVTPPPAGAPALR